MARNAIAAWLIALALGLAADGAVAQLQLPGATPATPAGGSTAPATRPAQRPQAAPMRRPEDVLPGRVLRFLGSQGQLVVNRAGTVGPRTILTATMTGVGRRGNDIRNICTPVLNGGQPLTLSPLGRPAGLPRYEAAFEGCSIHLDLLPDAVFVTAPNGACRFSDECVVDPTGLWGPVDRDIPADREIERARAAAEKRLIEARRTLSARLGRTPEGRAVIQEQAAFPAFREQNCRNYGTTDAGLGYCALKFTEARASALEARIAGRTNAEETERRAPAGR